MDSSSQLVDVKVSLPKLHQHVDFPSRGVNTPDLVNTKGSAGVARGFLLCPQGLLQQIGTSSSKQLPTRTTQTLRSAQGKYIDDVTHSKTISGCAYWKPWLTGEVLRILRAQDAAFRAGDTAGRAKARANLSRGNRDAERHLSDARDARSFWRGLQNPHGLQTSTANR